MRNSVNLAPVLFSQICKYLYRKASLEKNINFNLRNEDILFNLDRSKLSRELLKIGHDLCVQYISINNCNLIIHAL